MLEPHDPALDAACTACAKGLHGACLGWWWWCPCACGLDPNDPRTNLNGHQGTIMSSWRVAEAIKTLQGEVNKAHPDRPRSADGTIGDTRHAATKSDHNPTDPHPGVVTAWDITTAPFTIDLAEKLRLMGKAGDKRVKYVIYRGQIASPKANWAWRPYSGFSKHFDHIHLSVADDRAHYDSTAPWNVCHDAAPSKPAKAVARPAAVPAWWTAPHKLGDVGQEVASIRKRLKLPAGVTFDETVDKAVRYVQHAHGLVVDGVVGTETARAIG